MPKIIYIAERKPGFTEDEFVARWRQHGALSMTLPMWSNTKRYVQASVVHPAPVAGASADYDAVGVCWFYEAGNLGERTAEQLEEVRILEADELKTFAHPIAPVCIAVDETALKTGEGSVTAYAFFNDAAGGRQFAEQATEQESTRRVTLNVKATGLGGDFELPYQAIVEVSAEDEAALGGLDLGTADLAVVAHDSVLWPQAA